MMGIIRSCLTSGVVVLGASGLVITPVAPLPTRPEPPPVALAALSRPLAVPATVASIQPLDLLGQQVSFHVGFVADFVATGAQLVARQVPIPGTLVSDIQNGTPLPVAVRRALQTFADVEIDAGRELVGFAREYVNFQIDFLARLVRDVMTTVGSTAVAFATFAAGVVGQLVSSVATSLTPVVPVAVPASTRLTTPPPAAERHSDVVETAKDSTKTAATAEDTVTEQPKKPKKPALAVEAVTDSMVSAQGEVRSATTGTTDDVSRADENGAEAVRSKPDAAPRHEADADNPTQKDDAPPEDNAPQKDSVTNEKP
jgi:hypothetical protein